MATSFPSNGGDGYYTRDFGFAFFISFFWQEALGEDVWHADVIVRLSDV
jgi:hypothetical protein